MERHELIQALEQALDHKIFLSPGANQKRLEQHQSLQISFNSIPVLTRGEKEFFQLLQEGFMRPQTAVGEHEKSPRQKTAGDFLG